MNIPRNVIELHRFCGTEARKMDRVHIEIKAGAATAYVTDGAGAVRVTFAAEGVADGLIALPAATLKALAKGWRRDETTAKYASGEVSRSDGARYIVDETEHARYLESLPDLFAGAERSASEPAVALEVDALRLLTFAQYLKAAEGGDCFATVMHATPALGPILITVPGLPHITHILMACRA